MGQMGVMRLSIFTRRQPFSFSLLFFLLVLVQFSIPLILVSIHRLPFYLLFFYLALIQPSIPLLLGPILGFQTVSKLPQPKYSQL
jgi:hypothetical protein